MKFGITKIFFVLTTFLFFFEIISAYLLFNIDKIVHGDLYHYGLILDPIWANDYWLNMNMALITIWTSMILLGFLIVLLYFKDLKSDNNVLIVLSLLFLSVTFTAILSMFFMTVLEKIVSVDLGSYGVQYDFRWTHNYYLSSRIVFGLKIVAIVITTIFSSWTIMMLLKPKQTISKLTSFGLIITGTLALLFSTLFSISLGVNIGLGLLLFGIIISYITSQEIIKKNILTSQLTSTYSYLEENLKKFGKFDKTIYVPSYLATDKNKTVLILKDTSGQKPKTKNSTKITTKAYALISPGKELLPILEKKLNTNFAKVNLAFLQKKLPNLINDTLELAYNFQIKNQDDTIIVDFENSVFNDNSFNKKYSKILKLLGCPLSSAIGCAIAKATGKLVTLTEYTIDKQRKSTHVTYALMSETIKLTYDT